MVREKRQRLQAAIEYLITYAWLFVVLAVVLAALYLLGVFGTSFGVRATPGSCYVSRPYGPNTTKLIALAGLCNNEIPEFTVAFTSNQNFFAINPSPIVTGNAVSMTAWIYTYYVDQLGHTESASRDNVFVIEGGGYATGGAGARLAINDYDNQELDYAVWTGTGGHGAGVFAEAVSPNNAVPLNKWIFVAGTYNGAALTVYINAEPVGSIPQSGPIDQDTIGVLGLYANDNLGAIGAVAPTTAAYFHGYISNVQLYNTSLSQSEISELYYEGIGGAPINLDNLVAWYPLNGNGNDYGGNGYSGIDSNVVYEEQFLNYYSPP